VGAALGGVHGLVTMALVIGYLPTLYGAYSRRELQLLTLDDLSDEETTAVGFLEGAAGDQDAPQFPEAAGDRAPGGRAGRPGRRRSPVPGRLPAPGHLGVTLPPYEQAWADYRRLRADYLPELVAATELLLVPMEFRHHTARLDITR
jgi:hypothetical protein